RRRVMAQFTDRIEPKEFPKMPEEYRDLLTRLLTIQADCEIGGPHIYVDHWTLRAPTVDDQWRVARIASEEIDHCRKFLRMLGMVGLDRSDILFRPRSKREVDAFKVDMPEWGDFAAFGFLIDKVGQYQLDEMVGSSFLPTDDVLPTILREEKGHVAYGEQKLQQMMATPDGRLAAQRAIDKWYVVGLDMFGRSESARDRAIGSRSSSATHHTSSPRSSVPRRSARSRCRSRPSCGPTSSISCCATAARRSRSPTRTPTSSWTVPRPLWRRPRARTTCV